MSFIELSDLHLQYPVYGVSYRSLKKDLFKITTGRLNTESDMVMVDALRGINLRIDKGQKVGLIGHNGAGKSSLLKILAGIYTPSYGDIRIEGTVGALFNVHLGIDFESTGYENVHIRSYLLGLPRKQIKTMIEDIEEFTELKDFLAMPVKSYSAGMLLRLAFGLSTMVAPQILLVDEVINVGDAGFIHKAKQRLAQFVHQSDIMILASHSNEMIMDMCNYIVWLENGIVKKHGPAAEVMAEYKAIMAAEL